VVIVLDRIGERRTVEAIFNVNIRTHPEEMSDNLDVSHAASHVQSRAAICVRLRDIRTLNRKSGLR